MSQVYFWHKKMHHELNHDAKLLIALNTKKDKFSVSDVCRMYSELVGRILSEEFILMLTAQSKLCFFLHVNALFAGFAVLCWNITTGYKFQHAALILDLLKKQISGLL